MSACRPASRRPPPIRPTTRRAVLQGAHPCEDCGCQPARATAAAAPRPASLSPRSMAVRPGGLLVLELPHPSDLWGGYCLEDEQFVEAWDAQARRRSW